MNPDACEFVPQHKNPVIEKINSTLIGMVADYFIKSSDETLNSTALKLVTILDHQQKIEDPGNKSPKIDANPPVAKALVALTIARSNGLVVGMPYLKEICSHVTDDTYNSLLTAILNQIYLHIHSDKVKSTLMTMSKGEPANFKEEILTSVTNENIDNLPVHIPELINFMLELVPFMFEKRRSSEDRLIGPNQLCMDLLYLADCVFRLQIQNNPTESSRVPAVNGDEGKIDRATYKANMAKNQGVTEWYEFFCLLCEAINKIVPVVNYILLSSSESILSGAWFHSVTISTRQGVLNGRMNECAFYNISNLQSLFDSTLTRLRELIVQPDALKKWHARSSALDTLLVTASLPSMTIPSTGASDFMDSIDPDQPEDYTEDFEKFLASIEKK